MTSVETVTVKGSLVRSLLKFIETDLTSDQRAVLLRNLPPEYVRRFDSTILPSETVPVQMLNKITEEAAKAKGESLDSFGRRAGSAAASDAVKGIYRFFALVLTADALFFKASHVWSSLYSHGKVRVEDRTRGSARIVLSDFPSDPAFCARFTGWVERMTEMTGSTIVEIKHSACRSRGAACCEWKVIWK